MPIAINRAGLKIAYDDAGNGEPAVLFLPGWCAPRWVFQDLMARCATQSRVLVLDWRGHGESETPASDFGVQELADDALAVIEHSGAAAVIPVASAHSGWVAIELRRRLGNSVPGIVSLEWFLLGLPPQFREALQGMQDPVRWREVVNAMHDRWLNGVENPELQRFLRVGKATGFPMWSRAAREITTAFDRNPVPFDVLKSLGSTFLHLYSQPPGDEYFAEQRNLAQNNPWFSVQRLQSRTQFSMLEAASEIAAAIAGFRSQ